MRQVERGFIDRLPRVSIASLGEGGFPALFMSEGTEQCLLQGYASDAMVPVPRWEAVSPAKLSRVGSNMPSESYADFVAFGRIPNEVVNALQFSARENSGENLPVDTLTSLLWELQNVCRFDMTPMLLGFRSTEADVPTITWDYKRSNHPGLHIDSWEGAPASARPLSNNRVCVNLGPGKRYFYFIPQTVDGFAANFDTIGSAGVDELAQRFMRSFPDAPVYSALLEPGDYYIAPTERIIHDASVAPPFANTTLRKV